MGFVKEHAAVEATLEGRIRALGPWFHNLRIHGVETAPGHFLGDYPQIKFAGFRHAIPAGLSGMSVLDIGCNAGFYSFEMKRRGAARVLGIDTDEHYLRQARFAAEALHADVEFRHMPVWDVAALGEKFDLVIFMGVLYHLRHPLLALDLIHEHVARNLLLFQSMQRGSGDLIPIDDDYEFNAAAPFDDPSFPKMHFIEQRYAHDETNWWIPNRACVEAMLRSSGFSIEQHPEDEVYLCRWQPFETPPDGPHCVYPQKAPIARMTASGALAAEAALLDAEALLEARDLPGAIHRFNTAEQMGADPDRCSAGRWMAFMLNGDFAAAWRESDAIRRRGAPDPHRFWNGEDIRGKRLILRCLHGFGDAVHFLRYAPALRAIANRVTFEVPPRFVELARCFDQVDDVVTWGDHAPRTAPPWDVQMEVMELPYFFRTGLHDLPIAERYLHLPEAAVARVAAEIGPARAPRVGLVGSAGEWNPSRSAPRDALAPLLDSTGCEFWNLQQSDGGLPRDSFHEVPGCRDSILTLAALISQLDLVITVDTLAAHLAGALGVPAWVMLQYAADWRWMTGISRSPWYSSLRLFRQPRPGDWLAVIAGVQRCLGTWSNRIVAL